MKKIVIIFIAIFVVIAIGFLSAKKLSQKEEAAVLPAADSVKVWAEVLTSQAFELDSKNNAVIRELRTGDELSAGAVIETSKDGFVNLYFPDSSVLRVSNNTRLTLKDEYFDSASGKMNVKIGLDLGKIWSKIISLATPDSSWEVETSNAVATVRGTAFGMEFRDDKSSVIGSENKVQVAILDPETKKAIKNAIVTIEADKQIDIGKADVEKIKSQVAKIGEAGIIKKNEALVVSPIGEKLLETHAVSLETKKEDWIAKAKIADEKLNQKIDQLKEKKLEMQEIKKELRQEIRENIKEKIEEKISTTKTNLDKIRDIVETKIDQQKEAQKEIQIEKQTEKKENINLKIEKPEESSTGIKPKNNLISADSLAVVPGRAFYEITEGESVSFKAILTSGAVKNDVTAKVEWRVIGLVGEINSQGVFTAKLASDVAEYGEVSGTVVAIWTNPTNDEALLGKSAIFKVKAKVAPVLETEG